MREGSNEDEEEDIEDRDEDVKQSHTEDQSTSSSTNPRYEKADGGSSSGDIGSSSDHLVENDNSKGNNASMLMTPTTIQVNITRDSQDRTSEEEEVEAINWSHLVMKLFAWYADYLFRNRTCIVRIALCVQKVD